MLLPESSPSCSTLCQGGDLPSLPMAPREPRCLLPAVGTSLLLGMGMAVSVTLAALKTPSEGWGEEVLPDGAGTTAQHHPPAPLGASILLGLILPVGLGLCPVCRGHAVPAAAPSCRRDSPTL